MGTAALRGLLVVAAVVLGLFVLSKAFPSGTGPAAAMQPPPIDASPTAPQTTSPTAPGTQAPPRPEPTPVVTGVIVEVLNGTLTTGLAAATAEELEALGYDVLKVGDATQSYETTTLFFRRGDGGQARVEARALRASTFPMAKLERAPEGFDPNVQIRVVLGEDFAATR